MSTPSPQPRPRFSALAKRQGRALFERGDVEIRDVLEGRAILRVKRSRRAFAEVVLDIPEDSADLTEERLSATCTCDEPPLCRHIHAGVLLVRGLLESFEEIAAELGAGEVVGAGEEDGGEDDAADADEAAHTWRHRLHALDERTCMPDEAPAPKLEFFVSPQPWPGSDAHFCLEVRSRSWRKREKRHGPLGHKAVAIDALPHLPAAERRLLDVYNSHANHNSYHWNRRAISINRIWPVSAAAAPIVLAQLQEAEHVWFETEQGEIEPLQVDVRAPFRFELRRRERPGDGVVAFGGVLVRGEQQLAVADLFHATSDRDELIQGGFAYLWEQRRIIAIDFGGAYELAKDLYDRGDLELPVADEPRALAMLAGLPGAFDACGALLQRLPVGRPTAVVRVRMPSRTDAPIRAELGFDYDGELCAEPIERAAILPTDPPQRRDADTERALAARCAEVVAAAMAGAGDGGTAEPWAWPRERFAAIAEALASEGVRLLAEHAPLRVATGSSGSVSTGLDWFEVHGEVAFPGYRATLPELLRGQARTDGFVELDDGSLGLLPEQWLRRLESLRLMEATEDGDALRVRSSHALLLDAMLSAQADELQVDTDLRALRRRIARFDKVEPLSPARGFRGELRPYQQHGLGWLSFLRSTGLGG
ncbi:MAG TPA: hypothetical protein ENI87_07480, partial [bacterium]|nr:hypothetical protein [bacterium]